MPSSRLPCPSRVAPEQDGVRPRNSALAATHSSVSTFRGVRPLFGVIGEPHRARSWLTFSATERPSSDARSEDWVAGGPSGVCEKLAPATVCQQRGASRQWRRSVHSAGPPQASSSWLPDRRAEPRRCASLLRVAANAPDRSKGLALAYGINPFCNAPFQHRSRQDRGKRACRWPYLGPFSLLRPSARSASSMYFSAIAIMTRLMKASPSETLKPTSDDAM